MITFKPFQPEDVLRLSKEAVDDTIGKESVESLLAGAKLNYELGPAFTAWDENRPIYAAGIHLRRGKSGHLWSIFSETIENKKTSVLKSLKTMFDIVVKIEDLSKVVTESRIGFPQSQRLLEHMGFIRQRRNLNNDYYFYRRVI